MDLSLVIPVFIAGVLTFLAPCSLPLVPGYLAFISGVSFGDVRDGVSDSATRKKILLNGSMYVIGFSLVFVVLGSIFGLAGMVLAQYRFWLYRIGGIFIIFFGLYLIHFFDLSFFKFLAIDRHFKFGSTLTPGKPISSLIFGMIFALGWTPCIGPILGTVLVLVATTGTLIQGALLLAIFSLGLAVPYLFLSLAFGQATRYLKKVSKFLNITTLVSGIFLIFFGILIVTDSVGLWTVWFNKLFYVFDFNQLLDYL
ncbi:MAG: cytochrome c biogenesis protein CcdA [Patescibacteria group bacterium]|nr:cytochrome c biogenesis protein CcdA [Patescibacteria group bacterium]